MPIGDDEILEKGVNETATFGIDFTNWLATGETISSITSVTADNTDLTISGEAIVSNNVNFILSGGATGNYKITCKIVTSASNTYEVEVKLRVR